MDATSVGQLRLYSADTPEGEVAELLPAPQSGVVALPRAAKAACDPHELANRELIRPHTYRRGPRGPEPFSNVWFEEIEQRRYARHGSWLPSALEFHRHPGESVLLLHPGLGTDAVQYLRAGTEVTVAASPSDHPDLVRANLERHGLHANFAPWTSAELPFADGAFDVLVWNALHAPHADSAALVSQIYRVLKPGGKVIGLFPARYDAGFWQDIALPLQYLYWHRPPDPTTNPKTTSKTLHRLFAKFDEQRVSKRHLRRSELPHLWRLWPLMLLERFLGRVLILKAFKPLNASRSASSSSLSTTSLAA